jgi:hypothetical protein
MNFQCFQYTSEARLRDMREIVELANELTELKIAAAEAETASATTIMALKHDAEIAALKHAAEISEKDRLIEAYMKKEQEAALIAQEKIDRAAKRKAEAKKMGMTVAEMDFFKKRETKYGHFPKRH